MMNGGRLKCDHFKSMEVNIARQLIAYVEEEYRFVPDLRTVTHKLFYVHPRCVRFMTTPYLTHKDFLTVCFTSKNLYNVMMSVGDYHNWD